MHLWGGSKANTKVWYDEDDYKDFFKSYFLSFWTIFASCLDKLNV